MGPAKIKAVFDAVPNVQGLNTDWFATWGRLTPSSRTRPSWRRPPRFCPSRREEDRWSSRSAGASREGYPPGFSRCKVGLCLVASFFFLCAWLVDTELFVFDWPCHAMSRMRLEAYLAFCLSASCAARGRRCVTKTAEK